MLNLSAKSKYLADDDLTKRKQKKAAGRRSWKGASRPQSVCDRQLLCVIRASCQSSLSLSLMAWLHNSQSALKSPRGSVSTVYLCKWLGAYLWPRYVQRSLMASLEHKPEVHSLSPSNNHPPLQSTQFQSSHFHPFFGLPRHFDSSFFSLSWYCYCCVLSNS